ncbi:amino acid adenylation domain-containing protein [Pinirhizobacter sp.]|jgi:amino acid adenylation domain-containing protein|uniref:amino acid adenylation domain-containing protein n=1 Tax=Pinirhizobacter sp. TaxID=2950432 RepID=UPI002F3EDF7B
MSAQDIIATTAVEYDPFAQAALSKVAPTTAPQREIWLAASLEPEASLAYNEAISLRLRGALNVAALQAALQRLVDRHESFRATISADGQEMLIVDALGLACPLDDFSNLDEAAREAEVTAVLARVVTVPFDLEHGPLLRAQLLRLATEEHVLVLTAHHVICDGWSFGVVVNDLAALYAEATGQAPSPGDAEAFSDFARAQASGGDPADERYWVERFASGAPSLDLPTDRARPRQRGFSSLREDHAIDRELVSAIRALGAKRGASLYATLLASFGILLQRLAGQDDVVIGIPTAGQAAGGHHALVGHCVNVLPLSCSPDPATPFEGVLAQVRGDLLDAFEHQQYTLGSLLAHLALPRDPSRLPLVSVLFNLDQALDESTVTFPGLSFEFAGVPRAFENFELFINAVQVDGGLRLECQYNSQLFRGETIRGWLDAYETLLRSAVADATTPAGALDLLSAAARESIAALQPPATPFPRQRLAHEHFELSVDQSPDRVAVRHGKTMLRYGELEARSNRIARALRQRGVGRGDLVGICLGRGPDMLAALLGVMKSGAGYVPMDPLFPAERLGFMAEDAKLAALIADDTPPAGIALEEARVLSLARDAALLEALDGTRLPRDQSAATPDSIAYVIFTSGSTGRPKGVRVPHRPTSNFLASMQELTGIGADDRLVAVTTLSFDIAFLELMLPLCVGATVVLAGAEDVRDGAALRALVEDTQATLMQATPAGWRVLIEAGWHGSLDFRAITGGEPLALDLAEALLSRCGQVFNAYGPTETTVWSTWWKVAAPREGIWIGTPIANTQVHVLDAHGVPCPLGVPGEIVIGGAGVTLGYLDRPELTADRFIPDSSSVDSGATMYRTGDRGRWLANGQLEHLGRLDFQVKVRGYRIEPGEIENVLADAPAVARAVVIAREDRPGDVRLVAYVVTRDGAAFDEEALVARMKSRLPDYMVPQHIIDMPSIPLLPNGKIDRKALPAPTVRSVAADTERLAPRNEDERRVAAAMEAILALPSLDVRDNFFALGGHSLLAAQLTARLNREFSVALSFRTLFDAPTIAELALAVAKQRDGGQALAAEPLVAQLQQDRAPLSLMQQRLYALEELQPGRVTYNAPSAHRLRGKLDEAAFERAFAALIARQSSMRTSFHRIDDTVEQVVARTVQIKLFPAEDLSGLPDDEREEVLMQRLQKFTDTPFDLRQGPLFSASMFRLANDEHVFFFMPHHIIWDGWSFDIMYNELSHLYRSFAEGTEPVLPALTISYGDFAQWHARWLEGPQFKLQLAYWKDRLANMQGITALPTDYPRRPGMSGLGRTEWIRITRQTTDAMHEVARKADATLNMTLLALYYVLLSGMTGQRELVIGTPVRGRNHTEVESVMGYFNNLLPLHVNVDEDLSFVEFVRHVREVAIDSFGYPDVPLEYLQRELKVGNGQAAVLYQALFSFQDARGRNIDWGGLAHEQILLFQSGATEDLGLWFLEGAGGMVGGVTYNADILQGDTARMLRDRYLELMSRVDHDPTQTLSQLNGADAAVQAIASNDSTQDTAATFAAMFQARVDRTPDATALTSQSWSIGYAELDGRANRIAHCLRKRAGTARTVVGLAVEPGINRVAALIACLKTGITCVLLDPADGLAALADRIADSGVTVLVGDSTLQAPLQWSRERALWFDVDNLELVAASADAPAAAPAADDIAIAGYPHGHDAYPEAVGISQRALGQMLGDLAATFAMPPASRALVTARPSSPKAIAQHLLPLASGAELILTTDNEDLRQLVVSRRPDYLFAPAQAWAALQAGGWKGQGDLNAVCTGGSLAPEIARQIGERCQALWTLFGITAIAPVAAAGKVENPVDGAHAGLPLAHANIQVLGPDDLPRPTGALGEVAIGGTLRSTPFGQRGSAHPAPPGLVRTGFRGRRLPGGQLQVTGPMQEQAWRAPINTAAPGAPMNPAEEKLAAIWKSLLSLDSVRTGDNFFDVGGHSLLAVDMATRVQQETGVRLNLLDIANGTLGTLAAEIAAAPPPTAKPAKSSRGGLLGLLGLR